jgi:hypothetical protein
MRTHRRSWLTKKFVLLSEVLGYSLSGAIFVGLIVTLFIRVDITVHATAELRPTCHDVTRPEDFLIVEYLVADGATVIADQPIARVLLDPAAQQRTVARRQVLESVSLLENGGSAESAAALKELKRALANLPQIEDCESIVTPWSGVLRHEEVPWRAGTIPGGTALALVCDLKTLEMQAQIGGSEGGDAIAVGQPAGIVIERLNAVMMGEVAEVHRDDHDTGIRIEFTEIPAIVEDHFADVIVNDPSSDPIVLQANIIVGSRSLFMEMFGRGEHAR